MINEKEKEKVRPRGGRERGIFLCWEGPEDEEVLFSPSCGGETLGI